MNVHTQTFDPPVFTESDVTCSSFSSIYIASSTSTIYYQNNSFLLNRNVTFHCLFHLCSLCLSKYSLLLFPFELVLLQNILIGLLYHLCVCVHIFKLGLSFTIINLLAMVLHVCKFCPWEVEAGGSRIQDHLWLCETLLSI